MTRKSILVCTAMVAAVALAGCRVHVDKDANGKEKTVQVDTPFGGVHVNTDQISATDLGLPAYPGADIVKDKDGNQSADIHMGFGEWQLRVRAVQYSTADPQDKVEAFYKKALERYGNVITCQGHTPVGTPVVTSEGLNCSDDGHNSNFKFNGKANGIDLSGDLQLKAGSKRHQHIIGFDAPKNGRTQFALISLDLPANMESKDDTSD